MPQPCQAQSPPGATTETTPRPAHGEESHRAFSHLTEAAGSRVPLGRAGRPIP